MSTATATRCGHGCAHCLAIEAGLAGKPLTPGEFLDLHGPDLVEPAREVRAEWSAETGEAALAVEVAEIAYEDARLAYREILERARKATDELRNADPDRRHAREQEIASAVAAAQAEFQQEEARLRESRRRHRRLAGADSEAHRRTSLRESATEADAIRTARDKGRRDGALALLPGVLKRIGGS